MKIDIFHNLNENKDLSKFSRKLSFPTNFDGNVDFLEKLDQNQILDNFIEKENLSKISTKSKTFRNFGQKSRFLENFDKIRDSSSNFDDNGKFSKVFKRIETLTIRT